METGLNPQTQSQLRTTASCPYDYMEGLTPSASLQAAITRNDLAAVSYVLDSLKVDLVKTDDIGRAPIHIAIDADCDEDIIALIIARLPDWSDVHDLVDRYGYTPFMLAVERHKFNVAKSLMDMGGTICDDRDTYCPADRLAQKRTTIDHAKILLETRGNFSQAYSKALAWNTPTFLTLFGDLHDALRHACEVGDIDAAKDIVNTRAGVDASLVLMQNLDPQDTRVSLRRAIVSRNLIAAGADLNVALRHALCVHGYPDPLRTRVKTFLLLGASGQHAMEAQTRLKCMQYSTIDALISAERNSSQALITDAINGDEFLMDFWIGMAKTVNPDQVFTALMAGRYHDAVKSLLDHKLSPHSTLMRLLDEGDVQGVKFLVSAGADVSTVLSEMARDRDDGLSAWVQKLTTLNEAGVDLSQSLLDSTNDPATLHVAKWLIAAGVDVENAVRLAPEEKRSDIRRSLDLAARDVETAAKLVRNTPSADPTLLEDILLVQGRRARFNGGSSTEQLKSAADKRQAEGENAQADLIRAIARADWKTIKGLVPANQSAAAHVLAHLLRESDIPSARLLIQARTDITSVVQMAIDSDDHAQIAKLIASRATALSVLAFIVDAGEVAFAKDVVEAAQIDLFDLFRQVAKRGDNATLVKLLPLSADQGASELAKACSLGETSLATALFSAGADADRAFYDSISSPAVDSQAAQTLMALGINKSQALARALVDGGAQNAEALLILGADLDDALTLLGPQDREKVQDMVTGAQ